jgi:hypothetical protein
MTQGIRAYANNRFAFYLPQLAEIGNTAFRAKVMNSVVAKFGIGIASAATHYNHALKMQRAADPKSVEGLGRPEDKKGGRKPIHTVDVIKVKTGEVVASGVSKGAAELLISRAAASRKAKLAVKVEAAEAVTA